MDRFWSKVDKSGDCWTWTASKFKGGYGKFWLNGLSRYANRVSWELSSGTIPEGFCVLHRCDNPSCVRPDHLFLGTHLDNRRDCVAKGRQASGATHGSRTKPERLARGERNGRYTKPHRTARGERHGSAKLTWDVVYGMRAEYGRGSTQSEIAESYGVNTGLVSFVVNGKNWVKKEFANA